MANGALQRFLEGFSGITAEREARQAEINKFVFQKQLEQELAARAEAQKIIEAQERREKRIRSVFPFPKIPTREVPGKPTAPLTGQRGKPGLSPERLEQIRKQFKGQKGLARLRAGERPLGPSTREPAVTPEITKRFQKAKRARELAEAGLTLKEIQELPEFKEDAGKVPSFGAEFERVGRGLFGRDFSSATATQAQAERINKEIEESKARIAAARGAGTQEAIRKLPLRPKDRKGLINPDELMNNDNLIIPPPGFSQLQADEAGFVAISDQERRAFNDSLQIQPLVEVAAGLTNDIITATDPGQALVQFGKLTVGDILRTVPKATAYKDSLQAFLGVVVRALGGERGVLTDRDIIRVVTLFPSFRDTVQIKNFKLAAITNMMLTGRDILKASIAGRGRDEKVLRQRKETLFATFDEQFKDSKIEFEFGKILLDGLDITAQQKKRLRSTLFANEEDFGGEIQDLSEFLEEQNGR